MTYFDWLKHNAYGLPLSLLKNMAAEGLRSHYSGLWVGEAVPDESCAPDTPSNAIKWSLTLMTTNPEDEIALFGSGYEVDLDEITETGFLFYSLRGRFIRNTLEVRFRKVFDQTIVCKDFFVRYRGVLDLSADDQQPYLRGTWSNVIEGTSGTFMAGLQKN